jgi:hypothetical protein
MDGARMAKCKSCKTNIPDGKEYCNTCLSKDKSKESYLDSLLSSVKNTTPAVESIYKKKGDTKIGPIKANDKNEIKLEQEKLEQEKIDSYQMDIEDIKDFDQYDLSEDLNMDDMLNEIVVSDEELFGIDLNDVLSDNEIISDITTWDQEFQQATSEDELPDTFTSFLDSTSDHNETEYMKENNDTETIQDNNKTINIQNQNVSKYILSENETDNIQDKNNTKAIYNNIDMTNSQDQNALEYFPEENETERIYDQNKIAYNQDDIEIAYNQDQYESEFIPEDIEAEYIQDNVGLGFGNLNDYVESNINPNEIKYFEEDDYIDPALDDLLNELDLSDGTYEQTTIKSPLEEEPLQTKEVIDTVTSDEVEDFNSSDDDFLSLLNQIDSDDPVAADVQAINDLLKNNDNSSILKGNTPSDVGDVFSDALKAVSSLEDPEMEALHASLSKQVTDINDKKGIKETEEKSKSKKDKKKKLKNKKEKVEGKSFFQKLFGNVPDENANKQAAKSKKLSDDESAVAGDNKNAKKKPAKGKKSKVKASDESDEILENGKSGSKTNKKEAKKEKKEKKKKDKEVIQVIDEIEEDTGRINRVGASIVFIFFGILVTLLLIGTNVFSYSLSIQNATNYFNRHKYTQAYNEVYGKDIKDEDIEIYDKIMTVMFVNKQLNSYNNFYAMKKYPDALDSLLKGLKRYDKYLELATMLGIKSDLDYVRTQILSELNNVFHLSEEDALKLINEQNKTQYSLMVYNVVRENLNN